MTTIVVPMAGRGSRFAEAGYAQPKPLIPVMGVPMIEVVIANLRPRRPHRFVFVCQQDHLRAHGLDEKLRVWAPDCAVIGLDGVTEGAACTVLLAADEIVPDEPLMIANCDQFVDASIDDYLATLDDGYDGLIMTMTAHDPKWSFVGLGADRLVERVVEKQAISDEATVGIYNFARGGDFLRGARDMIERDERVNGEFYVAPVYNDLIASGARIGIANIGSEADGMYGLGIPADLELFTSLPVAARAIAAVR